MKTANLLFLAAFVMVSPVAAATDVDAIVRHADQVLSPEAFRAQIEMTTRRSDGSKHVYRMQLFKNGRESSRLNFSFPPDQAGTQMLRQDENMWMYIVNLKRAVRIASRQQLMGGDFNNGDLLRLSLVDDYNATLASESATEWEIDLRAKSNSVTYDRIVLRIGKKDMMPLEEKIFTTSGKHIKTLRFEEPKDFGRLTRPARVTMIDELDKNRSTILAYSEMDSKPKFASGFFTLNQLGR